MTIINPEYRHQYLYNYPEVHISDEIAAMLAEKDDQAEFEAMYSDFEQRAMDHIEQDDVRRGSPLSPAEIINVFNEYNARRDAEEFEQFLQRNLGAASPVYVADTPPRDITSTPQKEPQTVAETNAWGLSTNEDLRMFEQDPLDKY